MWQDQTANVYSSSSSSSYYPNPGQSQEPLQFYAGDYYTASSRPSLDGQQMSGMSGGVASGGFGGNIQPQQGAGPWWTAFGTGGFEGEPPLLEGMSPCSVFCRVLHHLLYRTGNQFFPYPSKVNGSSQPSKSCRRTHHGRCRFSRSSLLLFLLWHLSATGK